MVIVIRIVTRYGSSKATLVDLQIYRISQKIIVYIYIKNKVTEKIKEKVSTVFSSYLKL